MMVSSLKIGHFKNIHIVSRSIEKEHQKCLAPDAEETTILRQIKVFCKCYIYSSDTIMSTAGNK